MAVRCMSHLEGSEHDLITQACRCTWPSVTFSLQAQTASPQQLGSLQGGCQDSSWEQRLPRMLQTRAGADKGMAAC